MRRTEQAQGLRLMKFEEVYARTRARLLSQAEASEMLGMSERTFRRWRDRFEADGAEGLYDRRLGRVSARRAAVDEVVRVLELFDTRYWDFTAKHFHEKLVAEHDVERSYNWVRLTLQAYGRMRPAPRRGAHRRKRLRRALPGDDAAPGRLTPRVGARLLVGPDRHQDQALDAQRAEAQLRGHVAPPRAPHRHHRAQRMPELHPPGARARCSTAFLDFEVRLRDACSVRRYTVGASAARHRRQ